MGGLITTYSIAVGLNHINRTHVPYISETGVRTPENGIFTIVMFGSAVLILITLLIRFKQVWDNTVSTGARKLIIHAVNCLALLFGIIAAIGILLVGSYRMNDGGEVHNTAVNMSIVSSLMCFVLETAIGPVIKPKLRFRCLLLGIRVIFIVFIVILSTCYAVNFNHKNVSASIEWVLVTLIYSYFLTFVPEFRKLNMKLQVEIREKIVDLDIDMERVWYDGKALSKDDTIRIKLLTN